MANSHSDYERLFSSLQGLRAAQIEHGIFVGNRSRDVVISNNTFETTVNVNLNLPTESENEAIGHPQLATDFSNSIARNKFERGYRNVDHLERFIFECNSQGVVPVIRTYSLFSHISSIRSREGGDEYNALVLAEKDLLDRMLGLNFRMRFVVSLDVPIILTAWGSSLDQASARIAGLTDRVDDVANQGNVEIAVDDLNSMDNQFILHDRLLIRAMSMDPDGKYDFTKYETNAHMIKNAIRVYDQRFANLRARNQVAWGALGVTSWSAFIKAITRARVEEIYSRLSRS